jgi:hypothetical protein
MGKELTHFPYLSGMNQPNNINGLLTLSKGNEVLCENTKCILTLSPPIEQEGKPEWVHGWHIGRVHVPALFYPKVESEPFEFENKDTWYDVHFKAENGKTYTGKGFKTLMDLGNQVIDLQGAEPLTKN